MKPCIIDALLGIFGVVQDVFSNRETVRTMRDPCGPPEGAGLPKMAGTGRLSGPDGEPGRGSFCSGRVLHHTFRSHSAASSSGVGSRWEISSPGTARSITSAVLS